jgi:hypothetical protein
MAKRSSVGLAVAALSGSLVAGWAVRAQSQDRPLCTMPGKVTYSPGAMVKHEGEVYRCLFVWGQDLTPSGVAWVKMVKQGDTFVPKEPSDGR